MVWLDTFKARIVSTHTMPSANGKVRLAMPTYPIFTFSKYYILFPKMKDEDISALAKGQVYHRTKYTLSLLTRHDEAYTKDAKFQATFNDETTYNLQVNIWNGILLRIIHGRYSIQKHWEWYWKTILAILFGALITYFTTKYGYKDGFKDGYKRGLMDRPHG